MLKKITISPQNAGPYPFVIGSGCVRSVPDLLPAGTHNVALVSDRRVFRLYGRTVVQSLSGAGFAPLVLTVAAGEKTKNRQTKRFLEDRLIRACLGRDTTVVALGGGMTSDLAGFVAATYMRGIPYLTLPTTLLAMVDASVGGKTAINTPAGKNLLGAFHQPTAVVSDVQTLRTLPVSEIGNGLSEMVKHAVVADAAYLEFLCSRAEDLLHGQTEAIIEAVVRSVVIKAEIVSRDTRESNLRQVLNLGHTVGHAFETVSGHRISHGHAVAAGLAVESEIAVRMGLMEAVHRDFILEALDRLRLPRTVKRVNVDRVMEAMVHDKKTRQSSLVMALPKRPGVMVQMAGRWSVPVDPAIVRNVLNYAAFRSSSHR